MDADLLRSLAARIMLSIADDESERKWGMATLVSPELAVTSGHAIPGFLSLTNRRAACFVDHPELTTPVPAVVDAYDSDLDLALVHLSQPLTSPELLGATDFIQDLAQGARWESSYFLNLVSDRAAPAAATIDGFVGGPVESRGQTMIGLAVEGDERAPSEVFGAPVMIEGKLAGVIWLGTIASEIPEPGEVADVLLAMPIAAIRRFIETKAAAALVEGLSSAQSEDQLPSKDATDQAETQSFGSSGESDADQMKGATAAADLDEAAFFRRLNQSSKRALGHAEGIRRLRGRGEIHIEYLIAGLFENEDGPTRALFSKNNVDHKRLGDLVVESGRFSLPSPGEYEPVKITELPARTRRVTRTLIAAQDIADRLASPQIQTRHLLYGALSAQDSELVGLLLKAGIDRDSVPLARSEYRAPKSIVYVNADNPQGRDLLNIQPEVDALSAVISAKDVMPPLSIGLFGDWGSGKSFFMGKMDERIRQLTKIDRTANGKSAYCSNIVQIWFNAWSYVEADLWASLVTDIFEELARAIDKDEALAQGSNPATAKARLLAAMASARDVVAEEERRRDAAKAELGAVEQHIVNLKAADEELQKRLGPRELLKDAYRVVVKDETIKGELDKAATRLNIPEAERATSELRASLLEIKGIWSGLRFAFRAPNSLLVWIAPVGVLIGVAALWLVIPRTLKDRIGYVIGSASGLVLSAVALFAPFVKKASGAARMIKEIRESNKQRIEEQKKKIEDDSKAQQGLVRQKLNIAEQRVETAKAEIQRLDDTLKEMRADKQLLNFIRERSVSTDYTSRLGTVARARRDFKQLSDLMDRVRDPAQAGSTSLADGQPELLLPRIDRIVLYIDDLDRCSENDVVKVLEAVHLLLAFKLFVVIVAVDSRWLLHSLRKHSSAFQSLQGAELMISEEEMAHWESTPLNYLEKIFQIPFYLRPMRGTGFERLIDEVAGESAQTQPPVHTERDSAKNESNFNDNAQGGADPRKSTKQGGTAADSSEESRAVDQQGSPTAKVEDRTVTISATASTPQTPSASAGRAATTADGDAPKQVGQASARAPTPAEANPTALRIEDWERQFMKRLHPLIASPRSAKRFLNIYRLLRASITDENDLSVFVGNAQSGQHRAALLLLAILTGYPSEATDILRDLLEEEHSQTWWEYVDGYQTRLDSAAGIIPSKGTKSLSRVEQQRWQELLEKLRQLRDEIPESQSCDHFVKWAPRVARYSFQSGRVLGVLNEDALND